MTARTLQKQIHVACRDLGLDADARRDVQVAACGKSSMRAMSEGDLKLVVDHLKERGWKPAVKKGGKRGQFKKAKRRDVRFIHVLWSLLKDAGCLDNPTREGLNAFIRRRFSKAWSTSIIDVDALEEDYMISDVINALKAWCDREDIDYSGG